MGHSRSEFDHHLSEKCRHTPLQILCPPVHSYNLAIFGVASVTASRLSSWAQWAKGRREGRHAILEGVVRSFRCCVNGANVGWGHWINVSCGIARYLHWISLSTSDLGLVQLRVISDSRCKWRCKQLWMPIRRGPNADLHRVITDFSRYIRLNLQ